MNHDYIASDKIIHEDKKLKQWFSDEQIETIAGAAENHRASSGHELCTIYCKIVAEADRLIDPTTVIRRTIQYGLDH